MSLRIRATAFWLVLCALSASLPLAGASSAAAAPIAAWQIKQGSLPTQLSPGTSELAHFHILISNVGGEEAGAGVNIIDEIPSGLKPSASIPPTYRVEEEPSGTCSVAASRVACEVTEPVRPGAQIDVLVPVEVETGAPGAVTNVVTVASPAASSATSTLDVHIGSGSAPFELVAGPFGLSGSAFDEEARTPLAGAHPFDVQLSTHVSVEPTPDAAGLQVTDPLRSLHLELPAGLVANPLAVKERCPLVLLQLWVSPGPGGCPAASQVGMVRFSIIAAGSSGTEVIEDPLIDVVPPPGVPAEFAFEVQGTIVHIHGGLGGNFHLTAGSDELLTKYPVNGVKVELWGNPSDHRHDFQRHGPGLDKLCPATGCEIEPSPVPFLTMPTSCTEPLILSGAAAGWLGGTAGGSAVLEDLTGQPVEPSGCAQLAFEPTIESKATTGQAETASGLDFSLHQPQSESLDGRSTAALKDATVTLPEGVSLNPSAANGLAACSENQMGYAPEEGKIRFKTTHQTCPAAAKVGTVTARTPLLEHPLPGAVYVAKPFDNPFGSLLAIYLAIEDEEAGIVAKLAGRVVPDPVSGQLETTFTENPELPLEDIELHLFSGTRGVLTTPLTCGSKVTAATLTPWSTPEGIDAHPTASFNTSAGCYPSEAAAPKAFSLSAGTLSPLSGAYSPFVLRLARPDATQHLAGIETTLPEGLLGKLAGIPYCSEAGIVKAISREAPEKGKLEQQEPSCSAASEVGTVNVSAGSGSEPIPVTGHAYLAGPYKGAPLSLVVIVPAVAGPFDLGTVVDRVALNVGEYDARIHTTADPLPLIRDGIPLDVRSIELRLNRPTFTLNPTSCEVKAIEGSVRTQTGQIASLDNRFQVGECTRLGFKPSLKISLSGATKRSGHPALKAVVSYPKRGVYANIARAQVALPHSEFLDQGNIGQACTKPVLAARACPARSIYGRAKAWTPLLDKPVEGPVYLVGGYGYKLPALVAELSGQIRVLLVGKVDTGRNHGIRNTFEAVPDAPVERFKLEMKGGRKYGLLQNSENICHKKRVAGARFVAQNGKSLTLSPVIHDDCRAKHKKRSGRRHQVTK